MIVFASVKCNLEPYKHKVFYNVEKFTNRRWTENMFTWKMCFLCDFLPKHAWNLLYYLSYSLHMESVNLRMFLRFNGILIAGILMIFKSLSIIRHQPFDRFQRKLSLIVSNTFTKGTENLLQPMENALNIIKDLYFLFSLPSDIISRFFKMSYVCV